MAAIHLASNLFDKFTYGICKAGNSKDKPPSFVA